MSKYTPGPWIIGGANYKEEAEIGIHGKGEYGFIICDMHTDGYDNKTQEANARLIAAAPDQNEALEMTQILLERLGLETSDEYQCNARALAKARGES